MKDEEKTKKELINELAKTRRRIAELERSVAESGWADEFSKILILTSPIGLYIVQDGKLKLVSPNFQKITGYSEDELVGMDPLRLVVPEHREMVRENAVKMLKKERQFPYEFGVSARSGEMKWIVETVTPIQYQGRPAALGNFMDITELKRMRELLREKEQRYQMLIQNSVDAIYLFDPGTKRVLEANPAFLKLVGCKADEISQLTIYDFIYHDKEGIDAWIEQVLKSGGIRLEGRIWQRKDGNLLNIHLTANKIHEKGKDIIFVVARDETEKIRQEKRLKENKELLDNILSASPVGIGMFAEGILIWGNSTFFTLFGAKQSDYAGRSVSLLCASGEEYRRIKKVFKEYISQGKPAHIDAKMKRKDGSIFDAHLKASSFDTSKPLENLIVTISDISWRKEAEAILAEEKERLSVTLRSIGDGVICTDAAGAIILMNKIAQDLTGWKEEEAIGKPLTEVFHIINEETRQRCGNPVDKVIQTGGIVGLANHTVLISRDGTERVLADSGAPILDRDGKIIGVVLVFRDITKQREMEKEFQRVEKLESIGLLAGGIAHDFNNLLMAILGNISMAKMYASADDKLFKSLEEAEKASLCAKDLTQQLLTFATGGEPVKKAAFISELIKDSASFVLRGSNVRCDFSLPDDLWPVEVDKGQMTQVFNNLIINADQAMPEGGIIKVKAENISIGAEHNLPVKAGKYVKITVKDEGTGIAEKYLPQIFDPYFTTKQKGSGLGLTTAYSIIRGHNGYISVESELGVGTSFYIYLPASEKEPLKQKEKAKELFVGKGKVLLMDDEEAVREVVGEMLKMIGYEVEFAKEGAEAVEFYKKAKESAEPFDAVILDLTVPGGMGGKDAIQKLLEIDPGVKAIVSSGYSNDPIMSDFKKYGFRGVVAKPYKIGELSEELHRLMRRKQK